MNWISSVVVMGLTLALFFKYRPREEISIQLCVLCGFLAVVTPLAPDNTWFLQAVSITTKTLAVICCFLQLQRERRHRRADALARARARRAAAKEEVRQSAA